MCPNLFSVYVWCSQAGVSFKLQGYCLLWKWLLNALCHLVSEVLFVSLALVNMSYPWSRENMALSGRVDNHGFLLISLVTD